MSAAWETKLVVRRLTQRPKQAQAVDNAWACGPTKNHYEDAAAFADEVDELEEEDSLVEDVDVVVDSFFAGVDSLLESPELSLTVLDPLRLSVR